MLDEACSREPESCQEVVFEDPHDAEVSRAPHIYAQSMNSDIDVSNGNNDTVSNSVSHMDIDATTNQEPLEHEHNTGQNSDGYQCEDQIIDAPPSYMI